MRFFSLPFHVWLISIYPCLFIYENNISSSNIEDLITTIVISTCIASTLFFLLMPALRDLHKVALIVTLSEILFYSYGHIYELLKGITLAGVLIGRHAGLLPISVFCVVLPCILIIKTSKSMAKGTLIFNMFSVVLLLYPSFRIVTYHIDTFTLKEQNEEKVLSYKEQIGPNIFYIIMDAYANQNTLRHYLNFENDEFLHSLEQIGFYIARRSHSNYDRSNFSIPSTLNMEYHPEEHLYLDNIFHLITKMDKNRVFRILKEKGYSIVNFDSGINITSELPTADLNLKCGEINDYFLSLINTTLCGPFERIFRILQSNFRNQRLCVFDRLSTIEGEFTSPIFVFAHIILPHDPYIFGPDGEPIENIEATLTANPDMTKQLYFDQLIFANKLVLKLVSQLLAGEEQPPVIILQSDHGPRFGSYSNEIDINYFDSQLGILNAYYLPGSSKNWLCDSITSVNSFRMILNEYFDAGLPLLEDRYFVKISGNNRVNDVKEITQKVKAIFQ